MKPLPFRSPPLSLMRLADDASCIPYAVQLLFGYVWSMSTLLVVMALVSVASALLGSVTGAQVGTPLSHLSSIGHHASCVCVIDLQLSSEIPPDLTGAVLGVSWAVETFSKIVRRHALSCHTTRCVCDLTHTT
jgi:hypothetical protein